MSAFAAVAGRLAAAHAWVLLVLALAVAQSLPIAAAAWLVIGGLVLADIVSSAMRAAGRA